MSRSPVPLSVCSPVPPGRGFPVFFSPGLIEKGEEGERLSFFYCFVVWQKQQTFVFPSSDHECFLILVSSLGQPNPSRIGSLGDTIVVAPPFFGRPFPLEVGFLVHSPGSPAPLGPGALGTRFSLLLMLLLLSGGPFCSEIGILSTTHLLWRWIFRSLPSAAQPLRGQEPWESNFPCC